MELSIAVYYDKYYYLIFNVEKKNVNQFISYCLSGDKNNSLRLLYSYQSEYQGIYNSIISRPTTDITINVQTGVITYKGKFYNQNTFSLKEPVQLVKFKYYGGTNYAETRYVKIDKEDDKYIVGRDLEKDEERRYLKSKMTDLVRLN